MVRCQKRDLIPRTGEVSEELSLFVGGQEVSFYWDRLKNLDKDMRNFINC